MHTITIQDITYIPRKELATESCRGCAADGDDARGLCAAILSAGAGCSSQGVIWEKAPRPPGPPPMPPETKDTNPKEAVGDTKVPLALVPDVALMHVAAAFAEGALKYGAYNWRVAGVRAGTYKSAAERHLKKWWNGERTDPKSRVHHLANAAACCLILLDAEVQEMLNDDRPPKQDMTAAIAEIEATLAHLRAEYGHLNVPPHTEKDGK